MPLHDQHAVVYVAVPTHLRLPTWLSSSHSVLDNPTLAPICTYVEEHKGQGCKERASHAGV